MKYFLKMLETARLQNRGEDFFSFVEKAQVFVFPYGLFDRAEDMIKDGLVKYHDMYRSGVFEDFIKENENNKPVQNEIGKLLGYRDNLVERVNSLLQDNTNINKFASPFPVISIESLSNKSLIFDPHRLNTIEIKSTKPDVLQVKCILAIENGLSWDIWTYIECNSLDGEEGVATLNIKDVEIPHYEQIVLNHLAEYINLINNLRIGTEQVRQRVKIGTGSSKKTMTIKQISYVYPKKDAPTHSPLTQREIDWSHRWFTRGHWREFDGLGKNRDGVYCEQGRTWVKEHIKGPEDRPLVKKTHIVKSES